MQGTPPWFDAIRLGEAAHELSRMFSENGDTAHEGAAPTPPASTVIRILSMITRAH